MEIQFFYDVESARKSIGILRPFAVDVPAAMRFRYPREFLAEGCDFSSVLESDEGNYDPSGMRDSLVRLWKKRRASILKSLETYCKKSGLPLREEYFCSMTFYGPYGFYDLPDTVFVNVAMGKDALFLFETMLHELLHVVLCDQLESKDYIDREKLVDNTFVEIWGEELPLYEKQFPE
jgi:hypothetical protein